MERLDKILSSQGVGSRKEAGILIRRGLVHVNGILATRPETKTDPERDQITIEGKPLRFQRHVYLMMNKPAGVVSASRDSREKTVVDLVPPALSRRDLFPAGRLDRDTTGLLILTDDGELAHRMLSPKKHVYKLYEASVDGPVGAEEIEKFAAGVALEDGTVCLPAGLTVVKQGTAWETLPSGQENVFGGGKKGAAVETGANRRPGIGQDFKGGGMQGADKRGAGADFSRGKQAFLRKEKFKWSNLTKFPKLV